MVAPPGETGAWRVERVVRDGTTRATLRSCGLAETGLAGVVRSPTAETPEPVGAPFLAVLDLPPLPGREDDSRPMVAVAAQPWRRMEVQAGADAAALRPRARVEGAATVGRLMSALQPGVRGRWDRVNSLTLRLEGAAPQSRSEAPVLGGANSLAVRTVDGWELLSFRNATPLGDDVWRLGTLLRGLQGTEVQASAGAEAGAVVVAIDDRLARLDLSRDERGLPLLFRAGPAGGPPGGAGVSEATEAIMGVHDRPWSPVRLRARVTGSGLEVCWTPRRRLYGDGWDTDRDVEAGLRFRVAFLEGDVERRVFDVEGTSLAYDNEDSAVDLPDGLSAASVEVSAWGAGWGWGPPARLSLAV